MWVARHPALLAILASAACGKGSGESGETNGDTAASSEGEPGESGMSAQATAASTTSAGTTTMPSTGSTGPGGTSAPAGDLSPYDLPPPNMPTCDVWLQDCDPGQKCAPVDSTGTGQIDTNECVPIETNPKQAGEACTVASRLGYDDCDLATFCLLPVGATGGEGLCAALCQGSSAAPECADGSVCDTGFGGTRNLCRQLCDPVLKDCQVSAEGCFSYAEGFLCYPEGTLGYGEPCANNNACASGLGCRQGTHVPGCASASCCTYYCDLQDPSATCVDSAQGQECVPEGYAMNARPGYEHVGVCGFPA